MQLRSFKTTPRTANAWTWFSVCAAMFVAFTAHAVSIENSPPAGAARHVIEFRARPGGVAGHSYVMFGFLDSAGRLVRPQYAGFRPADGAIGFILGSVVVYAGTFDPSEDDLEGPVTTLYRRALTPAQYRALVAEVAKARADMQLWNLLGNNCNDFVARLAEAIGLKTPSTLLPPDGFIDVMRSLNEP